MTGAPRNLPELALSRSALDRQAWRRAEGGLLDALLSDPQTAVIEIRGDRVLAAADGSGLVRRSVDEVELAPLDIPLFLGRGGGRDLVGIVRTPHPDDADLGPEWLGLRTLGLTLDDLDVSAAAALLGMAEWHRTHGFCPRCGGVTRPVQAGWVRRCEQGHDTFPALSPAVIMAVTDDRDRLLLARNVGWPAGRMSVLAGFVEPGESLEAAVAREVLEEVGVVVEDVTYAGNQPWPFPASLMLAFRARARGTEVHFRDQEIAEARWFDREELRAEIRGGAVLSGGRAISVAYHLIETWLGESIADLQPRRA